MQSQAPAIAGDTEHDDTSASPIGIGTADQEIEQESAKPEAVEPPKPSVRFWWEIVHGAEVGFSVEYLLEHSIRWSKNPYETVLRPRGDSSKGEFELENKKEIVEKIAAVFQHACPETGDQQPHVYFRGKNVHVRLENPAFLEALYKNSVSYEGNNMVVVSKGWKGGDVSVYKVNGLEAQKLEDFRTKLRKEHFFYSAIVACNYDVAPLGGGPVFSGELFLFSGNHSSSFWGRSSTIVNWSL